MDTADAQQPGDSSQEVSAKVEKVPPKRPQRTLSDESEVEATAAAAMADNPLPGLARQESTDKAPTRPPRPPARTYTMDENDFEEVDNNNNQAEDEDNEDDDDDDDDIVEEADRRSKFMMKGGSHSIQKVLKGDARKKKGFSRFDRRALGGTKQPAPAPAKPAAKKPMAIPQPAAKPARKAPMAIPQPAAKPARKAPMAIPQPAAKPARKAPMAIPRKAPMSIPQPAAKPAGKKVMSIPRPAKKPIAIPRPAARPPPSDDSDSHNDPPPKKPAVSSSVLEALGDSYSDNIELDLGDDSDAEEFAAEVERRSKFIAKGGSHSIQKVLKGEARSAGKSGPSRINRRNIPAKPEITDVDDYEEDEVEEEEDITTPTPRRGTPMRTISVDSTDSWIEDEANRRSRFMLKGASHSIRNLLSGKAKKEKRGSVLDRRKLHFKHEADAAEYNEKPHAKPQEINEARLRAEAEAKARAAEAKAARKASKGKRFGGMRRPKPATKKPEDHAKDRDEPSSSHPADDEDESDRALVEEADRRALMFKGGSHSIRNLFAGKSKKKEGGGINRFNRRKMHFKKESDAVHYTEKSHLTPEEINKRHREEAARLRAEAEAKAKKKAPAAPPMPSKRISMETVESATTYDSKVDIGDEPSKRAMFAEIEYLHGDYSESDVNASTVSALGASANDYEDEGAEEDVDTDDDIVEEADRRSKFMMKGGSHSIQKVLKGEARAKKGVSRFDRRKMHFKKESEAIHSHDDDGVPGAVGTDTSDREMADNSGAQYSDEEDDEDADIIEKANRRSKFMMKGGSHSIQKVLRGEARAKKGVTRFDRRKMHFKKGGRGQDDGGEEMADESMQDTSGQELVDHSGASQYTDEEDDEDADIIEEANRRSKFMMKGGSHSIQKVLRGEARSKKGVTRFDRRKMHFKKESEAVHSHDHDDEDMLDDSGQHTAENELADSSRASQYTDEEDEDADIVEEADRRSKFMMKGGSHSIQKVLRGEARAKKGVTRFDRRKMHFKKESQAAPVQPTSSSRMAKKITVALDDGSLRKQKLSNEDGYRRVLEEFRVHSLMDEDGFEIKDFESLDDNGMYVLGPPAYESGPESSDNYMADSSGAHYTDEDDEDADIIEEADRRSKFMMKGGSHSIQKVLRGEARAKKGVTRFDRRKMHFKKESQAIHSHDDDGEEIPVASGQDTSEKEAADTSQYTDEEHDEDADIIEEADRRSKFMMKGGSHSIQKVLRGEARAKKGVTRFDRRKMHFKKESQAVHSHDGDQMPDDSGQHTAENELADSSRASQYTDEEDEDADIIEEANRRSKFMMKGGSHSIQKVLRGEARAKKGVTRFDRRKMHFQKGSRGQDDAGEPMADESQPEEVDNSAEFEADDEEEDADIIEEANRRSKFMMKGGSHSIQKVLRGEARAKKGVTRFDRRKMHFKKESEAIHSHDNDGSEKENSGAQPGMDESAGSAGDYDYDDDDDDADIIEEADRRSKFMMKGGSHSIQKVLRGEARAKKGVTRFDRRKMHFKKESQAVHCHDHDDESQKSNDSAPRAPTRGRDDSDDDSADFDEDDADIIEEADRRSKFMMKGGSHSIQKVLRGEARAKKGPVNRFDRRKMHFKHEAEAIHSHDNDPPKDKDQAPRGPMDRGSADDPYEEQAKNDDSEEFDEEELQLLAEAENDPRKRMMLKGASHSIRNIFSGKAKKKEKVGAGMERRKSQLKHTSMRAMGDASQQSQQSQSVMGDDDASDELTTTSEKASNRSVAKSSDKAVDRRKKFTLKGASNSIRNLLGKKKGKKPGQKAIDAEIERLLAEEQEAKEAKEAKEAEGNQEKQSAAEAVEAVEAEDDDLDAEDREIEEEANRRSNFMAKGGSYSITKVLKGDARKKKDGITRFDRRKMHFKKESDAIHSHDHDGEGDTSPQTLAAQAQAQPPAPQIAVPAKGRSPPQIAVPAKGRSPPKMPSRGRAPPKLPARAKTPTPVPGPNLKPAPAPAPQSEDDQAPQPPARELAEPDALATAKSSEYDDEDLDDEDADILEEADRRSKFMSKGGSYSIQKVLKGEARAKKGVSRFDRRKMHFKKESEAIHSHDHDAEAEQEPVEAMDQQSKPTPASPPTDSAPKRPTALNAKMPSRRISDGMEENRAGKEPVPSSPSPEVSSEGEATQTTQTSTVDLTGSPKQDPKEEEALEEAEEAEVADVDRRRKFTLKGASHSIKKVLAGKARSKKDSGVSRLDRRRIHLKSKSAPKGDTQSKSSGK